MSAGNHEHEKFIRIVAKGCFGNGGYVTTGEELQWVCIHCGEIYYKIEVK